MKKYGTVLSLIVLLGLWQFAAVSTANDFLMPYPAEVFSAMLKQCADPSFYQIVFHTLTRSVYGLLLALLLGGGCAFLAYFIPLMKYLLAPLLLLTKSIPNISYIIIVLVWFGSSSSVIIIPFLILFPIVYANLYQGLQSISQDLKDVMLLYPKSFMTKLCRIYIPLLYPSINATLSSGLGLAFKVGVMAEIIGQVQIGIGRQLNVARLNMDMTVIFAWTIWIILLLLTIEAFLRFILRKIQK